MTAYYNEIDSYAAQWLRNLIAAGHIATGDVDERSIVDVQPSDLVGYTQCHFFAGIGGWSYAARLAGWPDDRELWTGSCPCQPFSVAGKGSGFDDERHLWPDFFRLIDACRPGAVMGEQVASKDGLAWLDTVLADLEGAGYAAGAVDLCAAGVGAPHIRQRLYWLADTHCLQPEQPARLRARSDETQGGRTPGESPGRRDAGRMADDDDERLEGQWRGHPAALGQRPQSIRSTAEGSESDRLADAHYSNAGGGGVQRNPEGKGSAHRADDDRRHEPAGTGPTNSLWRAADWLGCRDGKWRPVEPGTFPLAHGIPARVGRLRAYGNAIVPQVAAEVITAFMECRP